MPLSFRGPSVLMASFGLLALAGCTGTVGDSGGGSFGFGSEAPGGGRGGQGGVGGRGGASGRSPDEGGYAGNDSAGVDDRPAPTTRFARLTHAQWRHTVEDLLQIEDASQFTSGLRDDPTENGFVFENNSHSLSVDESLWNGYRTAATEIARYVTEDAKRLDAIVPAEPSEATERARAFIESFGLKAHRQPLTEPQVSEYMALYEMGPDLYPSLDAFPAGMRLLIEAFLQSPFFLYRVELSDEVDGEVVPLDSYEVAARLSYMIWDTMPDDVLFDAAEAGELTRADAVGEQARRMLDDPRAEAVVASFHEQLLETEKLEGVSPASGVYPDAPDDLGALAQRELELFVRDVFSSGGSYADVLTSNETFVNAELARIYGLDGNFAETFEKVELPADERAGVFTQVGFLAANATSVNPDPIHRGAFIGKRIACLTISAPPNDIPAIPSPEEGSTNREAIEALTEEPGTKCAGCHTPLINPFGFPFESYDAIGQHRTEDNGKPVETSTTPLIDGSPTSVQGAVELAGGLATSESVHECYARHWLEYAYGRPRASPDDTLIERLGSRSREGELSLKDLIVGLVKTESFLTRSTEELP